FRVLELTWEFMNNPAQITITPKQKTVEKAEQVLYHVGREEKFNLLLGLLKREGGSRILIFSNTREEARRLEDRLARNGWQARALTGDVDQKKRLRILNDFKEGVLPVLVATDVASRGLHIEGVSHVVNWDLPPRGPCRRTPRTTCTASAARRERAPPARPSAWRTSRARSPSSRSSGSSARRSRSSGRTTTCTCRRSSPPARSGADSPRSDASDWPRAPAPAGEADRLEKAAGGPPDAAG